MPRPLAIVLLAALLLPASAFAYNSSQTQNLTSTGQDWTYTFSNLPAATSQITVFVDLDGDYNSSSSEYADVYIEGQYVGRLSDNCGHCNTCVLQGTYTVSPADIADGTLIVEVRNSSAVHVLNACGCECGTVNVSYSEGSPPTADAGGPYTVNQGVALPLDASGTVANTGTITSYEWDCTNDGTYDVTSTSPTSSACTYPDDGTYTVGLRVTNTPGLQDTDTATVTVTNTAPTANAGGPYVVGQGTSLAMDGSASNDPDGSILLYEWDCTDNGSYDVNSASPTGASCAWPDDGPQTLRLRVTDDDGATATATASVLVTNAPPTAVAGGPYTVNQGALLTMNGGGSSDSDGTIVNYEWDCEDDGIYDTASTSPTGSTCQWIDDGTATLRLRVTDDDGGTATSTAAVTITNTAPVADAGGPYTTTNGVPVTLDGTQSADPDGTIVSYAWDCEPDGVIDGTGATVSCTYPIVGNYTPLLLVTDDDGAVDGDTATVSIGNAPPTADAGGPYAANEGSSVSLDGSGSTDVGSGFLTNWEWDCTDDGVYDISATAATGNTCFYDADGTYTVRLRVTDDYGAQAEDTATVSIANVAPTVVISGPTTGDEGTLSSWSAAGTDPSSSDAAALTYSWAINGNGISDTGAGPTMDLVPADEGTYTVSVTVSDPQGATGTDSLVFVSANVPPTLDSWTIPAAGDEGSPLAFSGSGSDQGSADVPNLTVSYDYGDGTVDGTGSHTYVDDGTYTVTITISDGDGGSDSETGTVVIANLPPEITNTPATDSWEGVAWSWTPTVTDPGTADVLAWSQSASAPAGMTIDPNDGAMAWTPTYADTVAGPWTVVVTVDDGDGGTDSLTFTLNPTPADDDSDGIPDGWELANGLDPTDPNDGALDPDMDGLTNADEYDLGQDPNVYDGPSFPLTLLEPIGGVEISSVSPDLVLQNASDPQNDTLIYDFEVYDDAGLTSLVTTATDVAEGAGGETEWKVDVALPENGTYWWRARVSDPFVSTDWTAPEAFFVNALNDAPGTPLLSYPIDGETVGVVLPELQWTEVEDIDSDAVTYDVEVTDGQGTVVASATGVVGDGTVASWTVEVALTEDTEFLWSARAVDEHGLTGAWAADEAFFVSGDNGPPAGVAFVAPTDGAQLVDTSPDLVASEGVDPEGTELDYEFELDTAASFDSPDYETATLPGDGSGLVTWSLAAEGIDLPQNTVIFARVRAVDGGGVTSVPDTIAFFIRGDNDAPNVPVLVAPEDEGEGAAAPVLEVEDPVDPEGDLVYVDFLVATDEELIEVVTTVQGVLVTGEDTTTWSVDTTLQGDVWWSARATDEHGAASDWAAPRLYRAPTETVAGDDDDSGVSTTAGCDCRNDLGASPGGATWALALLGVLGLRRRRG